MRSDLIAAIQTHQAEFGISLTDVHLGRLADYYDLILAHNEFLHLVAPMPPDEFAIRHILESLTLLEQLPAKAKVADVGAGAGLPSIPCLLVRDDLRANLIESKEKKAKFLETAVNSLGLSTRTAIINRQFEEADPADCQFVTCRALDKFTEKLPRMLKWSKRRRLILFGGHNLREALEKCNVRFDTKLMPLSEQRYLFSIK